MTTTFEIKGLEALEKKLRKLGEVGVQEVKRTLYTEAEAIMTKSKALVPVVTGALRGSGFVELPKTSGSTLSVTMGYGGPAAKYALIVHENPRAGKTKGVSPSGKKYKRYSKVGQWKYLEQPFNQEAKKISRRVAVNVNKVVKSL